MNSRIGSVDLTLVEIVRHALISAANEMKANLMRSAFNPIIYEHLDFSVGLFSEQGETLAEASGLPEFLCDMPNAIRAVLREIGGTDRLAEGDIYLINDPYACCFHTNDVTILKPVFCDADLSGFVASRAHWYDLGGKSAIASTDATEVYQEGLIMRAIRLYQQGCLNDEVVKIITANSRLPAEGLIGDMQAQVGVALVGERRLLELFDKYGRATFQRCAAAMLRQAEQYARRKVQEMPDGHYEAELFLDNDGVDLDTPLKIKAAVQIEGDRIIIDLDGSSGPCKGPLNCNRYTAEAVCRVAFKSLTSPHEPANEGHFRPLQVHIPEVSILNAKPPSPTFWSVWTVETLSEVVRKALAEAIPDQTIAGDYGRCCAFHLYGTHPDDGSFFTVPNVEGGGWGGKPHEDGEHALLVGDIRNVPIEIMEHKSPVFFERYELCPDSGGAGCHRGGLGTAKDVRCLAPLRMVATYDRSQCLPWGLAGGHEGRGSTLSVISDGREVVIQKCTDRELGVGDVIMSRPGGGGGYGDPLTRPVQAVLDDVLDGLVSVERAREVYGVVVDAETMTLNPEATRHQRQRLSLDASSLEPQP